MPDPGSLFRPDGTDAIYIDTRDSEHELLRAARVFIERIWRECAPFVDPDLAARAPVNGLAAAFWELYLTYTLKSRGIRLVPRAERTPRRKGPDLLAQSPDVWIEAVAATSGTGPDRLEKPKLGAAYDVDPGPYVLRLRSAIEDKADQLARHIERGYVRAGEATVIAVSAALLEHRFAELPIPRIVRAVFGVGNLVVEMDRETARVTGHSVEYVDRVEKAHGQPVKTDLFLHPGCYAHVSAVLFSHSCWIYHPEPPGTEYILVHNPKARNPLPDGWLGPVSK